MPWNEVPEDLKKELGIGRENEAEGVELQNQEKLRQSILKQVLALADASRVVIEGTIKQELEDGIRLANALVFSAKKIARPTVSWREVPFSGPNALHPNRATQYVEVQGTDWDRSYIGTLEEVVIALNPASLKSKTKFSAVVYPLDKQEYQRLFGKKVDLPTFTPDLVIFAEKMGVDLTEGPADAKEITPRKPGPAGTTKQHPFTNTIGMKFVPVPGTKVLMCIHETRRGDYRAFAHANKGVDRSWEKVESNGVPVSPSDGHPVTGVSWDDAQQFCLWLSRHEGLSYRLPSDHEWSCAVGIGSQEDASASPSSKSVRIQGIYPWGRSFPPPLGAGNFGDQTTKTKDTGLASWIDNYRDGFTTTAPVMSFLANGLGLFDLSGNVWERCGDWDDSTTKVFRVARGGGWGSSISEHLLSSYREVDNPEVRGVFSGFRVVVVVAGSGG